MKGPELMADTNENLLQENEKLKEQIADLKEQIAEYKKPNNTNVQYKDRLFKFIFGNPEKKQWTLSLYNAMNGTNYTNPDDLQFNTIGDALYMGMKNDVSFLVASDMNLWEQQSSFNPNMPMRLFLYAAQLYEKFVQTSDYYQYSSTLQTIPTPHCVCFYNGTQEQPEKQVLKLSDAYGGDGDIEVKVTMLNVNYGKNQKLMEACKPLKEYAWLVDAVRKNQKEKMNLDAAVDKALSEMSDDFAIKPFLLGNRAEVKSMLITEYNEQKEFAKERKDATDKRNVEVASDMLKKGYPISDVIEISKLPKSTVQKLADKIAAPVV